ncbi:MAG: TnsA endonuclease N-terminal domain-containing protein [Candidatus Nitrosotenuis sp.]
MAKRSSSLKGRFIPKNPQKYVGNPNNIIFRSSWELSVLKFFDSSNAVLKYASEEFSVPYISPLDGKVHRYFPDFVVSYLDANGNVQQEIVEVKPLKEADERFAKTPLDKSRLLVNNAKWEAAARFAGNNGMVFRVITEASIFKESRATSKNRVKTDKSTKGTTATKKARTTVAPRSVNAARKQKAKK